MSVTVLTNLANLWIIVPIPLRRPKEQRRHHDPIPMNYNLYLQLPKPSKIPVLGTLAIDKNVAYFFVLNSLSASLAKPEIIFINPDGIMLKGYESDGFDKSGREKFKYQEWFCRYASDE